MYPVQSPPVNRPHLAEPSSSVNVTDGSVEDLVRTYMHLTHGANYDDPSPWVANSFAVRKGSR